MGWSPPKHAKIWGHLVNEVVRQDHCMFCGACVAACPINVLYLGENEEPVIRGPCAACQVCYYSCPRLELPLDEIETGLFGRPHTPDEETLGIYRAAYSARATDEEVWRAGQDGGTVTALLRHALDIGMVDCVVASNFTKTSSVFALGRGVPLKPVPITATTASELVAAAGSKYTPGGTLGGLTDAAASFPNGRIAIVALPCELQGLRRMYTALQATVKFGGSGIVGGRPVLTVGLFCAKIYDYEKLVNQFIKGEHGVDPSKVTKTVIKKGRFKVYLGGDEVINVPLRELESFGREECRYCIDYAAELADISIGALGSPDGWTTVLIRTDIAEQLFESACRARVIERMSIDTSKPAFGLLFKHAQKKKRENKPFYIRGGGVVTPPQPDP